MILSLFMFRKEKRHKGGGQKGRNGEKMVSPHGHECFRICVSGSTRVKLVLDSRTSSMFPTRRVSPLHAIFGVIYGLEGGGGGGVFV